MCRALPPDVVYFPLDSRNLSLPFVASLFSVLIYLILWRLQIIFIAVLTYHSTDTMSLNAGLSPFQSGNNMML